jgi:hypothetical protein
MDPAENTARCSEIYFILFSGCVAEMDDKEM